MNRLGRYTLVTLGMTVLWLIAWWLPLAATGFAFVWLTFRTASRGYRPPEARPYVEGEPYDVDLDSPFWPFQMAWALFRNFFRVGLPVAIVYATLYSLLMDGHRVKWRGYVQERKVRAREGAGAAERESARVRGLLREILAPERTPLPIQNWTPEPETESEAGSPSRQSPLPHGRKRRSLRSDDRRILTRGVSRC